MAGVHRFAFCTRFAAHGAGATPPTRLLNCRLPAANPDCP